MSVFKRLSVSRVVILMTIIVIVFAGPSVVRTISANEFAMDYLLTKYDADAEEDQGSFGVRALGLIADVEYVQGSAFGSGAGGRHNPDRIGLGDVGYLNNMVESGYVGAIFYMLFIVFILIICVKNLLFSDQPLRVLHSRIVLVLMIAGLQRTAIDASLWGGIFLVLLLRTEHMFSIRRTAKTASSG